MAGQLRNLLLALLLGVLIVLNPFGTPLTLMVRQLYRRCRRTMRPVCVRHSACQTNFKNSLKLAMVITGLKMLLHPYWESDHHFGRRLCHRGGDLNGDRCPGWGDGADLASRYDGKTDAIAQSIL